MKKINHYFPNLILSVIFVFSFIGLSLTTEAKDKLLSSSFYISSAEKHDIYLRVTNHADDYFTKSYAVSGIPAEVYMDGLDDKTIKDAVDGKIENFFDYVSGKSSKIEETEILEPVTDIDETKLQLPTSATDGIPYIKQVQGTGNLTFKRSEKATTMQEYYGITDLALYYATDIEGKKFYNSDWFKEYVLGSNKKYANMKINYKMVAASKVTTADIDSADLIYINGTYQSFVKGNNDLSMVIMAYLYNQVVQNHKALMMDYAGYDASLSNNISKLALLLWQEGQSSVVTAAKDTGIFNSTTSELVDPDGLFKKTDIINNLKDSILSGGNGNFVSGNVYVYLSLIHI